MMRLFRILALALLGLILSSASCNSGLIDPKEIKKKTNVVGNWELIDITKSVQIGDATIVVYIEFRENFTFSLSQQMGTGRFKSYSGTYAVEEGILSGKYSDGTPFATTYKVERNENILNLTTQNATQETHVYRLR